ncbi:SART-1 protein [Dipodascopsis tothii]|uniref:SART-1 protein n=1 Tax=Dipodascopsis tothii TaxID=44089 RepID=UPI0034D013C8
MADEEAISLEETNRIRVSLGLKPIPVPDSGAGGTGSAADTAGGAAAAPEAVAAQSTLDQEQEALDNWRRKEEEERAQAGALAARQRIQRAKDRVERLRALEGKSLAEELADETGDTLAWIKKSKKRAKKPKVAISHDDDEPAAYTTDDLKGLKVGHSLDEFGEAVGDVVLTLKDKDVLDEGEDELISTALEEKKRTAKNIENRKRKARYTGLDEDEDGEGGLLSRYDDEDEVAAKKFFTLDSEVISVPTSEAARQAKLDAANRGVRVSLDYDVLDTPESDYMPAQPAKIRKPKKRSKNRRAKVKGEDDGLVGADVVMGDIVEDDDEDLQALLAKQRQDTQRKKKATFWTPEMRAQMVREQSVVEEEIPVGDGLVIDDMSLFLSTIDDKPAEPKKARAAATPPGPEPVEAADVDMSEAAEPSADVEPGAEPDADDDQGTGFNEEASMSSVGLGDTLSMLRRRGFLKTPSTEDEERQRIQVENNRWRIESQRRKVLAKAELRARREDDRRSGKFDGMTQKEREEAARWENQQRQVQEARESQERFKNYKPDVKLEYKDEYGRLMTAKEAFKHLSHQFHGKGSGKTKTEKKLKRIEEESKKDSLPLF